MEFSFLLNSCLDIIQIRRKHTSVDQDLGLLHAIDERLAAYGWLTTTGLKFLIVVDTVGRVPSSDQEKRKGSATTGLRDSDLKPVSTTGLFVRGWLIISIRHSELSRQHSSS